MEKEKMQMLRAQASRLLLFLLLFFGAGGSALADITEWSVDFEQITADAKLATGTQYTANNDNVIFTENRLNYKQIAIEGTSGLPVDLGLAENGVWKVYRNCLFNTQNGLRWIGIKNCKVGQKIVITHNGVHGGSANPLGDVRNMTLQSTDGNTNTYVVTGTVGATVNACVAIGNYAYVKSISLLTPTFNVSVSAENGSMGSVYFTVGSDATHYTSKNDVAVSSVVHFNATPSQGYMFSGWKVNGAGEVSSTANPADVTIAEATSYTAVFENFKPATPAITASTPAITLVDGKNQMTTSGSYSVTVSSTAGVTYYTKVNSGLNRPGTYGSGTWTKRNSNVISGSISENKTLSIVAVKDGVASDVLAINLIYDNPNTYTVTYDPNGATSGTVPVDNTKYTAGSSAKAMGNTGNLKSGDDTWGWWNTQADGSGTNYKADEAISNIQGDITLYAYYRKRPVITPAETTFIVQKGQSNLLSVTYTGDGKPSAALQMSTDGLEWSNVDDANFTITNNFPSGRMDGQSHDYTVTLTPAADYTPVSGASYRILLGHSGGIRYRAVSDVVVNVVFAKDTQHKITFASNDNALGTVTATYLVNGNPQTLNSGQSLQYGTKLTFTATPTGSNLLWGWNTNGATVYEGSPKTVTLTEDLDITAQFSAPITFAANSNDNAKGAVTMNLNGSSIGTNYNTTPYPGDIQYVATPAANCYFIGWYKDQACTQSFYNKTNATLNLSTDLTEAQKSECGYKTNGLTLYAKFGSVGENNFTIRFAALGGWGVGGGVTITDLDNTSTTLTSSTDKSFSEISIPEGHTIRVSAPELGGSDWRLLLRKWTVDGVDNRNGLRTSGIAWTGTDMSFDILVTKNMEITASYGKAYTIEVPTSLTGGTAVKTLDGNENNNNTLYNHGTTITATATPASGYKLARWRLELYDGDMSNEANRTMLTENYSTDLTCTVTLEQYGPAFGSNAGFQARLTPVFVTDYTVTYAAMQSENEQVAGFDQSNFKVTDQATGNVIASGSKVAEGTMLHFNTPKTIGERKFSRWIVDEGGEKTQYYSSYQSNDVDFANPVTSDFTIHAFYEYYYNFTYNTGGGGQITNPTYNDGSEKALTADSKVGNNSTVALSAVANVGYRFKNWIITQRNNAGATVQVIDTETSASLRLNALDTYFGNTTPRGYNIELVAVFEKDVESVGSADNSTAFNTQFSKQYILEKGKEYTFTFRNQGSTGTTQKGDPITWYNWLMYVCTDANTTSDLFIQRADNYGWYKDDTKGNTTTDQHEIKVLQNGELGDVDMSTFQTDMQDAEVMLFVAFDDNGKRLHIYSRMTPNNGSGRTYCMTETTKELSGSALDRLYLYMSVEKAHITNLDGSTDDASRVTYEDATDGTTKMTNSDGMELIKGTYVGNGVNVTYTATPNPGYAFDHWIDANGRNTVSNANPYTVHVSADVNLAPVFVSTATKTTFTSSFNLNFFDATGTAQTQQSDWIGTLPRHSSNEACSHDDNGDCLNNAEVQWDAFASNSDKKSATKKVDEVYWKLTNDASSIKMRISETQAYMPGDVVTVKMLSTETTAKVTIGKHNISETVTANTPVEVHYTLTADDINSDGSINILRNSSSATRYHSISVACERYRIQTMASPNECGTATFTVASENTAKVDALVGNNTEIHFKATVAKGAPANTFFDSWTSYGKVVSRDAEFTMTTGTEIETDINLVANFGVAHTINVEAHDASHKVLANAATIIIKDQNGNVIPNGSLVTPSTNITVSITPRFGYDFEGWYVGSTYKSSAVEYNYGVLNEDITINAHLNISTAGMVWDFTDKTKMPAGPLYWENGTEWANVEKGFKPGSNEWQAAYDNATPHNYITEVGGLEFRGEIRLGKNNNAGQVILYNKKDAPETSGGIRIPVVKGQKVVVSASCSGERSMRVPGTEQTISLNSTTTDYELIASEDGYIEFFNNLGNNAVLYINKITVSNTLEHLTFGDCPVGGTVLCAPNTSGYVNPLEGIMPTGATVTWSMAEADKQYVNINESTGAISTTATAIPNGHSVAVTATVSAPAPFGTRTMTYYLQNGDLHFDQAEIHLTLDDNSSVTYWQPVHAGAAGGTIHNEPTTNIEYSVAHCPQGIEASIISEDDGTGMTVSITGKTGLAPEDDGIVIKAQSGAVSATYIIKTEGFVFNELGNSIYAFNGSYQKKAAETGVTYEITEVYGDLKDWWDENKGGRLTINATTGVITNFPSYDDNKGGALVIKATETTGQKRTTFYTLTVPYKKHRWQFYSELTAKENADLTDNGTENTSNATVKSPLRYGVLVEGNDGESAGMFEGTSNMPGAAGAASNGGENTDAEVECYNFNGEIFFDKDSVWDIAAQREHLRRRVEWRRNQLLSQHEKMYDHWDYTFKTLKSTLKATHAITDEDGTVLLEDIKKNRYHTTYMNEPLFSYRRAVKGDNARIITNTAGLVFNANPNMFGVNDNITSKQEETVIFDGKKFTGIHLRETDRSVLMKGGISGNGSAKLTIPGLKAGQYVRLYWYRHSDNAGDEFKVTNAFDLDGNRINENDILRFTGSAYYQHTNGTGEYRGCTFFKVAADGNLDIVIANANWTELYQIDVTDKFVTDLEVEAGLVWDDSKNNWDWGGTTGSGYDKDQHWNLKDNAISVVRNKDNHEVRTKSEFCTEGWLDLKKKIWVDNLAKVPTETQGNNPVVYIHSYPGLSFTWNGWNLDVEAKPVEEDATKLRIGMVQDTWAHIGNRLDYRMTALTNFRGTGTAKIVVKTKSSNDDDINSGKARMRYTLDKQEGYLPVGEYQNQTYPYTWDFTKYNMEGGKILPEERTTEYMHTSRQSSYGAWNQNDGDKQFELKTVKNILPSNDNILSTEGNIRTYNKWIFADGSQLTTNVASNDGATYIREAEGLRFKLNRNVANLDDADQRDILFKHKYEAPTAPDAANLPVNDDLYNGEGRARQRESKTFTEDSRLLLNGGVVMTVPNVNKGMYVFVKTSAQPTSVKYNDGSDVTYMNDTETVHTYQDKHNMAHPGMSNDTTVTMSNTEIGTNTYVYKVEKADLNDVNITIADGAQVWAVGVTDEFKNAPNGDGTMTDSRHRAIDYGNTQIFTTHELHAYKADRSTLTVKKDATGAIQIVECQVVPSSTELDLSHPRGLVLLDGASGGRRSMIPLFVPACNIPNSDLSGNLLIGSLDNEMEIEPSTNDLYRYGLTNFYHDRYHPDDEKYHKQCDYEFIITWTGGQLRDHSAYFEAAPGTGGPSMARQIYIYFEFDGFGESDGIDAPIVDKKEAPAVFYTLDGTRINGIPSKKGVYIFRGKKVYIK